MLNLCDADNSGRVRYAEFAEVIKEYANPIEPPHRTPKGHDASPHARFHYYNMTPESQLRLEV